MELKEKSGITLIALVVTIIILIILAGITINMSIGNNGIINRTKEAAQNYETTETEEGKIRANLTEYMKEKMNSSSGIDEKNLTPGPTGKPLANKENISITNHKKIICEDEYGNQVVIPRGFKVAEDSGTSVKEGIVIEDDDENQYVWIPVSNINHDGSNKIKVNSASEEGVEITLGRYIFSASSPGNPTLAENSYNYANDYAKEPIINSHYQELTMYRQSNGLSDLTGTNTTAREIGVFVNSVRDNKGYYIARYEASYRENGKAGSKASTSTAEELASTTAPETRTEGDIWTFIKQKDASNACQNLYETIKSDLMNSYAWDTAIIYIQAMGNTNYANANDGSGTLKNTGDTADQKCKIYDMGGNAYEWTTEYTDVKNTTAAYPCVDRGGSAKEENRYTRARYNLLATGGSGYVSFRPTLYL